MAVIASYGLLNPCRKRGFCRDCANTFVATNCIPAHCKVNAPGRICLKPSPMLATYTTEEFCDDLNCCCLNFPEPHQPKLEKLLPRYYMINADFSDYYSNCAPIGFRPYCALAGGSIVLEYMYELDVFPYSTGWRSRSVFTDDDEEIVWVKPCVATMGCPTEGALDMCVLSVCAADELFLSVDNTPIIYWKQEIEDDPSHLDYPDAYCFSTHGRPYRRVGTTALVDPPCADIYVKCGNLADTLILMPVQPPEE